MFPDFMYSRHRHSRSSERLNRPARDTIFIAMSKNTTPSNDRNLHLGNPQSPALVTALLQMLSNRFGNRQFVTHQLS